MREIKFRAWDNNNEEMLNDISINTDDFTDMLNEYFSYLSDDIEFMQYTTLKDKNGVEIYEGDIIMFEDDEDFIYLIEFYKGAYGWFNYKGKKFSNFVSFESMTYSDKEHFRVVGNKYQNKDLLLNN